MRIAFCAFALLPLPVFAEVFTLSSRANEAIVYPNGGLITHNVTLSATAGRHEVILPDLPPNLRLEYLRVAADDVQIGAIRYREDFVPPRDATKSAEIEAAEARIEDLEAQIQSVRNDASRLLLAKEAADARTAFLSGLGDSDALPSDAAALAQIGVMVSEQVLAARQAAFDAEVQSREVLKALKPLKEALEEAKAALAALVPESEDRPYLSMEVTTARDVTDTPISVRFYTGDAGWQPTYSLRLSDGDTPQLTIERGAEVFQETGENWEDVALVLSTQEPSGRTDPSHLPQDRRRLIDPEELQKSRPRAMARATLSMEEDGVAMEVDPVIESPVIVPDQQGLAIVYSFSRPVNIASGADDVRIPFDTLDFDAELVARAVPLRDQTAFLVAKFTNDGTEPLLSAEGTQLFFDGGLVGVTYMQAIAAGEEAEVGFGAIDGVQLSRKVLNRNEGDRGIISRSNEQTEEVRIDVTNLSDRNWQVELLDRFPYSEQEDLEITASATPRPDESDVDDRRGILKWTFPLAPGADKQIETRFQMRWPEGMVVR